MAIRTDFKDEKIGDFLEQLAKDVPTLPAGGSACALAGALAASLGRFVARLSLRRQDASGGVKDFAGMLQRLEASQRTCLEMMTRDMQAYERVIQARRMPMATEEQSLERARAMQEAERGALELALEMTRCGLELLQWAQELVAGGWSMARADAGVMAELANAYLWGSLWIARANQGGASDRSLVERYQSVLARYQAEAERLHREIREELLRPR